MFFRCLVLMNKFFRVRPVKSFSFPMSTKMWIYWFEPFHSNEEFHSVVNNCRTLYFDDTFLSTLLLPIIMSQGGRCKVDGIKIIQQHAWLAQKKVLACLWTIKQCFFLRSFTKLLWMDFYGVRIIMLMAIWIAGIRAKTALSHQSLLRKRLRKKRKYKRRKTSDTHATTKNHNYYIRVHLGFINGNNVLLNGGAHICKMGSIVSK